MYLNFNTMILFRQTNNFSISLLIESEQIQILAWNVDAKQKQHKNTYKIRFSFLLDVR